MALIKFTVKSDIMRRMDILLAGFVEQHRMKLPGGSAYPTLLRDHQLINYGTFADH